MGKKMIVGFLLDETGSMQVVKTQTIDGFNEYIETIKAEDDDDIRFTLTKFNSEKVEVVCDDVKLQKVAALTEASYQPANLTPLYDAIGRIIQSLEKKAAKRNVLVVIQTDGQENHSREFDRAGIFSLIDEKKKAGWTFAFLGADQDAWLTGQQLGLDKGNVMSYNSTDTEKAFHTVASATISYSRSGGIQTDAFFEDTDATA